MLLRNPLDAGIVDVPEYGVRSKRGDFEPLISEELFYGVQPILSGRAPNTAPRRRADPDFPFARLRPERIVPPRSDGRWKEGVLRVSLRSDASQRLARTRISGSAQS